MDSDPQVLDFHDSLVRESDLRILEGPQWLNDTLIGFFFEYLDNVVCKDHAEQLAFLCPGLTQLIKSQSDSEVGLIIETLSLYRKKYIFNAVNDSTIIQTSPSGTHWSLLVFSRPATAFYHYDSLNGYNNDDAQKVANKLIPHLGLSGPADFIKKECPQQRNKYDCGLHVIANVETLVKHFVFGNSLNWYDALESEGKRAELKAIIRSLK